MAGNDDKRERLTALGQHTLHHLEETSARVREALAEPRAQIGNVLASMNAATDTRAINNLHTQGDTRQRELYALLREPAVARVVTEDDEGKRRTYFVSRATPHRSPTDGSLAVGYNASPLGRIAALPVGGSLDAKTRDGYRTLRVIDKTILHTRETGGAWDSHNSVSQGVSFGPFTIVSLRALLAELDVKVSDLDELEAALADDRAAALVFEGLRRDALTKMELRELAVLDEYQDTIFRLPIDTRLAIFGPPGTGKTTTLIKRLGQKLDVPSLLEEERETIENTLAGQAGHATSWIMFTPTTLLEQYVEKAFAGESIPATEERIQTWDDCRRDLARNRFNILRLTSGGGPFLMRESPPLPSLQPATIRQQRDWFEDFQGWQLNAYWDDLRTQAQLLAAEQMADVARLGSRVADALPMPGSSLNASAFSTLSSLSEPLQDLIALQKDITDKSIHTAIAREHSKDRTFLAALATFLSSLTETDDGDEADTEDEEVIREVRVGKDAAVAALTRALRSKARGAANGRAPSKQSKNGRLIEWLGARGPTADELKTLGASLQVQAAARRFSNPIDRLVNAIPGRYRRYRRERQTEGRWYQPDGFAAGELHPLEVDIILLAALRTSQTLLADRRVAREGVQGMYATLAPAREILQTQVLVDEATDFSPVQLACMAALCDPASRSFVICGDFNQRITEWGTRSEDELRWVAPDLDIRSVSISYRHSRQLNELARAIAVISSPDVREAQLPERVNNDGFEPVLGTKLADPSAVAAWLNDRIGEIERLVEVVPPIAILVSREEDVGPMTAALNAVLASGSLRAVACYAGQLAGQDNDVRVFDVQHIKGLEFEAVFFVGIDRLAERRPDLFEKFLYVGATRAAMYLGFATGGSTLPKKLESLTSRFKEKWI